MNLPKLYFAGKMLWRGRNWRAEITGDPNVLHDPRRGYVLGGRTGYRYCGPFAMDGGEHGDYIKEPATHGLRGDGRLVGYLKGEGVGGFPARQAVEICLEGLRDADIVVAFIYSLNAYGTHAELAIAAELKKPTLIFDARKKSRVDELWFVLSRSGVRILPGTPDKERLTDYVWEVWDFEKGVRR